MKVCLLLITGAWWSGQFCKMGLDLHRCAFGRRCHYETDIDRQPQCVLRKIEPRLAWHCISIEPFCRHRGIE